MPTPWVTEVANYLKNNPQTDLGLHLTLTSEWTTYKWGSVAPIDEVSSLVNEFGYFHDSTGTYLENAKISEVEKELRAQIQLAVTFGIDFTHFDAHMGAATATPELFALYLQLGRENQVPVLVHPETTSNPDFRKHIQETDILINASFGMPTSAYPGKMGAHYANTLRGMQPGLNTIIIHMAHDNAESQAITVDRPLWGAAWRQEDYDFFTSEECAQIIEQRHIQLVTWREIRDKLVRK